MFKQIGPIIAGLTLVFLGTLIFTYFDLYELFVHTDKIFHISGGVIAAWYCSRLWRDKLPHFSRPEQLIILLSFVALVGVLWEFLEYSTSQPPLLHWKTLRFYLYNGSLTDTLADLVGDLFGAALFGLFYRSRSN